MSIIERLTTRPLILTDLDGTILHDGSVLEELENLTSKLNNFGIHFTFATGRSKIPALKYAKRLNINIPIICYGGAVMTDVETGDDIYRHSISKSFAIQIIENLDPSINIALYSNDQIYVTKKFQWIEDYCERQEIKLDQVNDLVQIPDKIVILLVGSEKNIDDVHKNLKDNYINLEINKTFNNMCEISSARGSKIKATKDLIKLLNLSKDDLFYFGDGPADLDLIKFAKYGFTVKGSLASQMMPCNNSIETPDKLGFINYINSII
ncbi:MAG: hypothetical protein CL762_00615 [Chloroflexi bacterium]|nr:hypothetical protein [Chloroflexota bacterium]|tara:strand:+ start:16317 stop:17114 length:798 start_codon:yes stop_codon:yes gene_type:complete